jgi:hypothetical protein
MKSVLRLPSAIAAVALLAACADTPLPTEASPAGANHVLGSVSGSVLAAYPGIQLSRPRIDVSDLEAPLSVLTEDELVSPEAASDIGPGSALLITIPNEGRFGCSANFVWTSKGNRRYLGAAGHCFLPEDRTSTHGAGADYNASGVIVQVCIANCDKGFRTGIVNEGTWLTLGKVAYARQQSAAGEAIGFDFGVVEIPRKIEGVVRTSLPVWGGPATSSHQLTLGDYGCHYGNGIVAGELYVTKARVGLGGISDDEAWAGDFAGAPGDSGSGMVACTQSGTTFVGQGAVGIVTHLGFWVSTSGGHGVVLGTNVNQAVKLATEAKLSLAIALQ